MAYGEEERRDHHFHGETLLPDHLCRHAYATAANEITGLAKLGGYFIHPLWRYMCHWELCTGYQPYAPASDLDKKVCSWLVEPKVNGQLVGEGVYSALLYDTTCSFLRKEWCKPKNPPNLEAWLERAVWMRGRSGTSQKAVIDIVGVKVKARSNKGVDAKFSSDRDLAFEMLNPAPQKLVVMQKSEKLELQPDATGRGTPRELAALSPADVEGDQNKEGRKYKFMRAQ